MIRVDDDVANVGVVMPVGFGRGDNVTRALAALAAQTVRPAVVILVFDGETGADIDVPAGLRIHYAAPDKHQPGMEQPRNIGVRLLSGRKAPPFVEWVWFVDSDVVMAEDALESYIAAAAVKERRVLIGPYDFLGPDEVVPPEGPTLYEMVDPRRPSFAEHDADDVFVHDLGAALACFSGNLVWPIDEFERIGGFWADIHHGRCEDGELGLRASALGVPMSFVRGARGWHLWHPRNQVRIMEMNARDVPMLNARHPWVEGKGIVLSEADGARFDVVCPVCNNQINTLDIWAHQETHRRP